MDEYRGLEFATNTEVKCLVVKDEKNENYIIVNFNEYITIARCNYNNIKETIANIKNNY